MQRCCPFWFWYFPGTQGRQKAWPIVSWWWPFGHGMHAVDPEIDERPLGQSEQPSDWLTEPLLLPALPDGQSMQLSAVEAPLVNE